MAPLKASQRRSQQQSEHLYNLGERGRKTGVTLRDTGVRDEHGMEPIDAIFSSPEKANGNGSDDGEVDMDLTTGGGPDPATLINGQNGNRLPIPRSRSPVKTYLKSPAVRNPHLGPASSPTRGSIVTSQDASPLKSFKRRLDFGMESRSLPKPTTNDLHTNGTNGLTNGHHSQDEEDEEDEEGAILPGQEDDSAPMNGDDSMQMVDGDGDYGEPQPELENDEDPGGTQSVEEEIVPRTVASRRKAKRARTVEVEAGEDAAPAEEEEELPGAGKKRGRPAKAKTVDESEAQAKSPKRRQPLRNSLNGENSAEDEEREPKRQRTEAKARGRKPAVKQNTSRSPEDDESTKQGEAPKKRGQKRERKRKSSGVGDSSVLVPRGPPMPKKPGLMIARREAPGNGGMIKTRSGRNSFRPLAFWRNEHVEFDQDEVLDDPFKGGRFVLPAVKEVHRVEEEEASSKPKSSHRRKAAGRLKRAAASRSDEDDEPPEPWEEDPGEILGEVVLWRPEHELNPPGLDEEVEVAEEQVALSHEAVETREVRNATFRFAKTLSLPFFGSGVVDLPPGSEKRPKNSRKMHMTFLVYSGRVLVTVNETSFRISRGGMWFVPRGNYYSIENDYDQSARIFFSQGCEVLRDRSDADRSIG